MGDFDFLKDYQPTKVTDGFEPFKGSFNCVVNSARIEDYTGDREDLKGARFFRYELEVAEGQESAGRKLWKSVKIDDADKMKKLADTLFTLGLEFGDSENELLKCAEQFVELTVQVKAWVWTPKAKEGEEDKAIQMHMIKGIAGKEGDRVASEVPF